MTEDEDRIELTCPHCGYTWEYGGQMSYYATCPNCRKNVPIKEAKNERK